MVRLVSLFAIVCPGLLGVAGCGTEPAQQSVQQSRAESGVVAPVDSSPSAERPEGSAEKPDASPAADLPESDSASAVRHVPDGQPDGGIQAARVVRPDDTRVRHDDSTLARGGVRHYESPHISLYTDIDPQEVEGLLPAVESVYKAWVEYFGELPPNRAGTEFQITGYVISDRETFDRMGLIPLDLPPFQNGRHRGAEFWMVNPRDDYYRRHLFLHEATHCFMTFLEPAADPRPGWYLEGMAELFATHRRAANGRFEFRVMPHNKTDFAGLGRITALQAEVQSGAGLSLDEATRLPPAEYLSIRGYSWSWAVCCFLDAHPDYHDRFRSLGRQTTGNSFRRLLATSFQSQLPQMDQQWAVYVAGLCDGYDVARAAFDLSRKATQLGQEFRVHADRGWQSTGLVVRAGQEYRLNASGRITVAQLPKPWVSAPQGVSFRYVADRPIGRLLLAIRVDGDPRSMLKIVASGADQVFQPAATGIVYLRVNDSGSELADNMGSYSARVVRNGAAAATDR